MKWSALFCAMLAFMASGCASFYTGGPVRKAAAAMSVPARPRVAVSVLGASEAAGMATRNCGELAVEYKALEARKGAWWLGLRAYLPSLELSGGSDERLSVYGPDTFTKNLSASVNQPVWDGGRLATARALEDVELALARAELDRKARDVGEAAIAAYRSVLAARARLAIQHASLVSGTTERGILAAEVDLGLATASDLMEADLSLAGMELEIAVSELEAASAEDELAEAIGIDTLPELSETIDPRSPTVCLDVVSVSAAVLQRSPELALARFGLVKKRAEARAAAFAWLPTLGLKASGHVSGSSFPLSRSSWSASLVVDFSGPLLSGSGSASVGGDPPHDSTARTSGNLKPLPDPAGLMSARNAALALRLEEERYAVAVTAAGRSARAAVTAYDLAIRKRGLAADNLGLSSAQLRLARLRVDLGQAVRSETVKAELGRAGREVDLVDAAVAVIAAERAIEVMIDSPPGSLAGYFGSKEGAGK